jgi:hypothetical protein
LPDDRKFAVSRKMPCTPIRLRANSLTTVICRKPSLCPLFTFAESKLISFLSRLV